MHGLVWKITRAFGNNLDEPIVKMYTIDTRNYVKYMLYNDEKSNDFMSPNLEFFKSQLA